MKRAKGTGTVFKLKGNRHKPYVAYVKTELVFNEEKQTSYRKRKAIGYFETQRQAQSALEKYLKTEHNLAESSASFDAIWQKQFEYMQADLSDKRIAVYKSVYKNYFDSIKNMPIKDIKAEQLKSVMKDCDKSSSIKTTIKSIMKKVFEYATENDLVDRDYSQYVKFKKDDVKVERKLFTKDEIEKLFEKQGSYEFDFVLILLYTGMRPKELINLTKDNIKDGYIYVVESKTKAGIRVIPIHDRIKPIVDNNIAKSGEYLMHTPLNNKLIYDNFTQRDMPRICEYLGVKHTLYECRHSFVTRAKLCELDFLCTQLIIGHKPTTVTEETYTHIPIEKLKDEMCKFKY